MIDLFEKFKYIAEGFLVSGNIEKAVLIVIYTAFFCGTLMLISDVIKETSRKIKKLIDDKRTKAKLKKAESKLDKHLRYLLEANAIYSVIDVFRFKVLSACLFMFFFSISVRVLFVGVSILFSSIITIMPYLILRVRLEKVRGKASHEAEVLINELLVKYRVKKYNIEEAIEEVMKVSRIKKTRIMLLKLLLKLRNTRNEQEIKEAINLFSYSIGTNWAKMLGSNIYQSSVSHINITLSLEDMLIQLREARILWEEQIKNTAEPRRMLIGIPLLYVFLLYVSLYLLEIPFNNYLYNQFASQQGVSWFILIIIGFLISVILVILLFSRKFDF